MPRAFLRADDNALVVFEEYGGSPLSVNFQTVIVGTVCASVEMGKTLELECSSDRPISKIEFASLQPASGTCGSYSGTNDAGALLSLVQQVFCLLNFKLLYFILI